MYSSHKFIKYWEQVISITCHFKHFKQFINFYAFSHWSLNNVINSISITVKLLQLVFLHEFCIQCILTTTNKHRGNKCQFLSQCGFNPLNVEIFPRNNHKFIFNKLRLCPMIYTNGTASECSYTGYLFKLLLINTAEALLATTLVSDQL